MEIGDDDAVSVRFALCLLLSRIGKKFAIGYALTLHGRTSIEVSIYTFRRSNDAAFAKGNFENAGGNDQYNDDDDDDPAADDQNTQKKCHLG